MAEGKKRGEERGGKKKREGEGQPHDVKSQSLWGDLES